MKQEPVLPEVQESCSVPVVLKSSPRYPFRDETLPHLLLVDGSITPTKVGTLGEPASGGMALRQSQALCGGTNMQFSNKLGAPSKLMKVSGEGHS